MQAVYLEDLSDPRLDVYRDVRQFNSRRDLTWFIAEGKQVVRRLFQSDWQIHSVLLSETAARNFGAEVPAGLSTYVIGDQACSELVGFNFHAGVMACAARKLANEADIRDWPPAVLAVACPWTVLPDNLGSILRLSAAFGVRAVAVGERSADPFSRRAVRVSMGNIFQLQIFQPPDLLDWALDLRSRSGFEIVAAERDPGSVPLADFRPAPRTLLVLGNEAEGVTADWVSAADRMVEIEMAESVDSLNVSTAAAILLHAFSKRP